MSSNTGDPRTNDQKPMPAATQPTTAELQGDTRPQKKRPSVDNVKVTGIQKKGKSSTATPGLIDHATAGRLAKALLAAPVADGSARKNHSARDTGLMPNHKKRTSGDKDNVAETPKKSKSSTSGPIDDETAERLAKTLRTAAGSAAGGAQRQLQEPRPTRVAAIKQSHAASVRERLGLFVEKKPVPFVLTFHPEEDLARFQEAQSHLAALEIAVYLIQNPSIVDSLVPAKRTPDDMLQRMSRTPFADTNATYRQVFGSNMGSDMLHEMQKATNVLLKKKCGLVLRTDQYKATDERLPAIVPTQEPGFAGCPFTPYGLRVYAAMFLDADALEDMIKAWAQYVGLFIGGVTPEALDTLFLVKTCGAPDQPCKPGTATQRWKNRWVAAVAALAEDRRDTLQMQSLLNNDGAIITSALAEHSGVHVPYSHEVVVALRVHMAEGNVMRRSVMNILMTLPHPFQRCPQETFFDVYQAMCANFGVIADEGFRYACVNDALERAMETNPIDVPERDDDEIVVDDAYGPDAYSVLAMHHATCAGMSVCSNVMDHPPDYALPPLIPGATLNLNEPIAAMSLVVRVKAKMNKEREITAPGASVDRGDYVVGICDTQDPEGDLVGPLIVAITTELGRSALRATIGDKLYQMLLNASKKGPLGFMIVASVALRGIDETRFKTLLDLYREAFRQGLLHVWDSIHGPMIRKRLMHALVVVHRVARDAARKELKWLLTAPASNDDDDVAIVDAVYAHRARHPSPPPATIVAAMDTEKQSPLDHMCKLYRLLEKGTAPQRMLEDLLDVFGREDLLSYFTNQTAPPNLAQPEEDDVVGQTKQQRVPLDTLFAWSRQMMPVYNLTPYAVPPKRITVLVSYLKRIRDAIVRARAKGRTYITEDVDMLRRLDKHVDMILSTHLYLHPPTRLMLPNAPTQDQRLYALNTRIGKDLEMPRVVHMGLIAVAADVRERTTSIATEQLFRSIMAMVAMLLMPNYYTAPMNERKAWAQHYLGDAYRGLDRTNCTLKTSVTIAPGDKNVEITVTRSDPKTKIVTTVLSTKLTFTDALENLKATCESLMRQCRTEQRGAMSAELRTRMETCGVRLTPSEMVDITNLAEWLDAVGVYDPMELPSKTAFATIWDFVNRCGLPHATIPIPDAPLLEAFTFVLPCISKGCDDDNRVCAGRDHHATCPVATATAKVAVEVKKEAKKKPSAGVESIPTGRDPTNRPRHDLERDTVKDLLHVIAQRTSSYEGKPSTYTHHEHQSLTEALKGLIPTKVHRDEKVGEALALATRGLASGASRSMRSDDTNNKDDTTYNDVACMEVHFEFDEDLESDYDPDEDSDDGDDGDFMDA